jgi:lipoprotein-anchoring transpeptidase ErfK/SrfK
MKRRILLFAALPAALLLVPSASFAEGFYARMAKTERLSWMPFLPGEIVEEAFSEDGEEVPSTADYRMTINLPARRLFLYEKDKILKVYPVAVGSNRYRTPVGPRYLANITWNPWWYPPPDSDWAKGEKPTPPGPNNPLGPVKMSLGGDIYLHATNKDYTVGTPASHGCMRMHRKDALELAWFFQSRLSDQTEEALKEKYKAYPTSSFYVPLKEKVPVDVIYERVTVGDDEMVVHPDIYGRVGNLEEQVLARLSTIGIAPWEVDPTKVEELKRLPNSTSVPIIDLL